MAKINRSDAIQKAVNDLALSSADDKIPTETLDKVQIVFGLNRQFSNFIIGGGQSTTGTITTAFPTVSTGAEIYITAISASLAKDATCDAATSDISVSVVPDSSNVATGILKFADLITTADAQTATLSLPYPLRIKVGSSATMNGSFSLGAMRRNFSIVGFTTSSF